MFLHLANVIKNKALKTTTKTYLFSISPSYRRHLVLIDSLSFFSFYSFQGALIFSLLTHKLFVVLKSHAPAEMTTGRS
jgi:hypothetical protein